MKALILSALLFNMGSHYPAQQNADFTATRPEKRFPEGSRKEMYRFPGFQNGTVYFKDGRKTNAKLNYNYRHGQLEFVSPHRDTLLLTGKHLMDRVEIGQVVFYVSEEYGDMEQLAKFGNVVLARKMYPVIAGNKLSHSDQKFIAGDSDLPSSLFVSHQGGAVQWLNNTSPHSQRIKSSFYLIDGNRRHHEASKAGFLYVYAKQKARLQNYFRSHKVSFRTPADIEELLAFCEGSGHD